MGSLKAAIRWFNENCQKLGQRYKDKWLAINDKGVQKSSTSYLAISKFARLSEGRFLLIKVPKNPDAAYLY